MRYRFVMAAMILTLGLTAVVYVTAQAPKKASGPRMPDGHPDLQGTYDLATITPLERRPGVNAVLTVAEAVKMEHDAAKLVEEGDRPVDGNRTAPPKGGDGSVGAAGNVGGYNRGWLDAGSTVTVVNGE